MTRGDSEYLLVSVKERGFEKGDVVEMTVRRFEGTGDVLLHKRIEEFTEDGKAHIAIEPEDTAELEFGTYSYDVQVTFHDIGVKTIVPPAKFTVGKENTYE
jgi:hypothetical protein